MRCNISRHSLGSCSRPVAKSAFASIYRYYTHIAYMFSLTTARTSADSVVSGPYRDAAASSHCRKGQGEGLRASDSLDVTLHD